MTILNQINCDTLLTPSTIDSRECIGNSLPKINLNFANLKNNDEVMCSTISQILSAINEVLSIPKGSIVSWSGTVVNDSGIEINSEELIENTIIYPKIDDVVQYNWAVCTGATINGIQTPNLIGRFLVGTGTVNATYPNFNDIKSSTYYLGETGGRELHRLNAAEIPQLQTTVETISLDTVTKNIDSTIQQQEIRAQPFTSPGPLRQVVTDVNFVSSKTGFVQSTGQSTAGSRDNFAHENRPPYYSLYYIMRIK